MDQIKIGRFIAEHRKKNGFTQMQLAEKLGITDRAVSKWETGKSLPDSSVMLELCDILGISVNDLLNGEVVSMDNYKEELEKAMVKMVKQKEESDRHLLALEIVIGVLSMVVLLSFTFAASFFQMADWLRVCLIVAGFVICLVGVAFAIRIEQTAGYYACGKCGHRYVPTFNSVLWAPHINRTRYMRCPECNKKSWNKKVIEKE